MRTIGDAIIYPSALYGMWEATTGKWYLLLPLVGIVCYVFFYRLRQPPVIRDFGLKSTMQKQVILSEGVIDATIQETGRCHASVTRSFINLGKTSQIDFHDIMESTVGADFNQLNYTSSDSMVSWKKIDKTKFKIQWSPKTDVLLYQPYKHTFEWDTPSFLSDDMNYFKNMITYHTGKSKITMKTIREIRDFLCFVTKKSFKDDEDLYRYAVFLTQGNTSIQYEKNSNYEIHMEIIEPKIGEICYIVWSHQPSIKECWFDLANKKLAKLNKRKFRKYFSFEYYGLKKSIEVYSKNAF